MPDERFLVLQMHELLTYLNQQGVITFLVLAQHGLVGQMQSPVDLTYLSHTVILFRHSKLKGKSAGRSRSLKNEPAPMNGQYGSIISTTRELAWSARYSPTSREC